MQLTRFHVVLRDHPVAGQHVLYATLGDSLLGVDERALAWLTGLPGAAGTGPLGKDEVAWLLEAGFLVQDPEADDASLRALLAGGPAGRLSLHLSVTEACNLACGYCFQKAGASAARGMSPQVEAALHPWVRSYLERWGLPGLEVVYFGGEPLLRPGFIQRTAERFARELGPAGFSFGIVTNGTRLDPELVAALIPLGLSFVKITLDGPPDLHDRARPFRNGAGSWDRILANLRGIPSGVRVEVGVNVPAGHEDACGDVLEALTGEGLLSRLDEVRFKPVLGGRTGTCARRLSEAHLPAFVRLDARAAAAGHGTRQVPVGPCSLFDPHAFAVGPDGLLYACDAAAGEARFAVGRIQEDPAAARLRLGALPDPLSECPACAWLPACAGGCRISTLWQEGHLGPSCERGWLESVGRARIARRAATELPADEGSPNQAA